ncbi:3-methyl-2-oxobutanoate hydroxymethyltransferase [Desulfomicrobium macestii]|uniref:3-methyl-2-oxobutanoate hydroxymethyltransferase n=2 Tax=Desulfomicrobium TaxID=898 RepID=A0A8G2C3G7_DESNO|nr:MULTISPECIES: 3-methyl-2-oxobutanoate hydroxymethyltransferase [Desulfomicrobium]MBE1424818.1 3-methyl-2-oxobutanoate hydroxymethyltransferase [Desulfomicrobium macestii]SFL82064.1 3-methyl-2-oxobutanoate hydroxymethyltransferase [Desulfomicrobium norvegicum]
MKTLNDFLQMKKNGEKIVMLTAYDYPSGRLAEESGIDVVLVGDSLGMVVLGYDSTVPVTMADMIHHTRAARRGAKNTFMLTDMPYLTYQISMAQAMENAARLVQEGGCEGVKIEGGEEIAPQVRALVNAGIPVCGHIGLTPQSATSLSGYKVQGRTAEAARKLLHDALALEAAGAFMIVLECIPAQVAELISKRLSIPTIGIGGGAACDGQVLVFHDTLGLFERFVPKFVKQFETLGAKARDALGAYAAEVRAGAFPDEAHSFSMNEEQLKQIYGDGRD